MIKLKSTLVTTENIARYGELLDPDLKEPAADSEVFSFWNDLSVGEIDGPVSFGMVRTKTGDLTVPALERHVNTTETMVPIDSQIILVLGPPTENGLPSPDTMSAVRVPKGQGVTLNKGTWHYIPLSATKEPCRTLIVFRQGTPSSDLEVHDLSEAGRDIFAVTV